MEKLRLILITSFFLFIASGCKDELMVIEEPISDPIEMEMEEEEEVIISGEENYLTLNSDYLFDQSKIPTFELNITPTNLQNMDNDPAAEEYVEASLSFEGETITPVGVRYKGSIGSFVGCLSGGNNIFSPGGVKTCTKLSMKIKINWEGREDHFYGLKKIQLHSMNQDQSQLHDRLGYWLFEQMDIPTPRSVHARLIINGEYVGLFSLVEQIDGRFTRYHMDDGDGNVYKEIWPLDDNGQAHTNFLYKEALKTNEDENPSIDIIKGLADDVNQANTDEELKSAISKWMDIDKIIAYCMVDRMIKHDDGPFHWYCFNGCAPHNFYFVEEPNNQKIHLIPWDLDNAFQNISNPNGVTFLPDDWGETSSNCEPFTTGFFGLQQRSAACDKLTRGFSLFEDEYEDFRREFIEGPFAEETVNSLIDLWSSQIRASTVEASQKHDDAIHVISWENAVQELKAQCQTARQ